MQVGTRLGTKYVGSGWVVKTKIRKKQIRDQIVLNVPKYYELQSIKEGQIVLSVGKNPIPVPTENPLKQKENHARRPSDTSLNSS